MAEPYAEPQVLRPAKDASAFFFLAPALLLIALFCLYPLGWMIWISLGNYNPVTHEWTFAGLSKYTQVFQHPGVWRGILNAGLFGAIYVPLTLVVAWVLALLLNRGVRSSGVLKAVFTAPYVMPVVAIALIWRSAYMPTTGTIDRILYMIGIDQPYEWKGWLGEPYLVTASIAFMCVWRDAGFFSLILLSALNRMPRQLNEMAALDGASRWRTLLDVTIPACSGAIALCATLLVINVQNVFQEILVMTDNGGPANWSLNIPFFVYRLSYVNYNWSFAAALSIVFFAVTAVIILLFTRILKRRLGWS